MDGTDGGILQNFTVNAWAFEVLVVNLGEPHPAANIITTASLNLLLGELFVLDWDLYADTDAGILTCLTAAAVYLLVFVCPFNVLRTRCRAHHVPVGKRVSIDGPSRS